MILFQSLQIAYRRTRFRLHLRVRYDIISRTVNSAALGEEQSCTEFLSTL